MPGPVECKVYVGNLGSQGSKGELERVFGYYGPLTNVWVARNPPGFAFIEFEEERDARDAVRALDGRTVCGARARVELSSGMTRRGGRQGDGGGLYGSSTMYRDNHRDDYSDRRRSYRSRSRSPRRRHSRSRSKSRERYRKSHSSQSRSDDRKRSPAVRKSRSRSRSLTPEVRRGNSKSPSPEETQSRRPSRSRSRSSN